MEGYIECPNCHKQIDADAKFCTACGVNLSEAMQKKKMKICKLCKTAYEKELIFCPTCGAK